MVPSQATLIVLSLFGIVGLDVTKVVSRELVNCLLNVQDSILLSHCLEIEKGDKS